LRFASGVASRSFIWGMGHPAVAVEPLDREHRAPTSPTAPGRRRDAIFTYDDITWEAAQRRGMCFPTDRVALALTKDPRVERLLICDQPRSAPIKLVKDALRHRAPFPSSDRVHLHQPLRLRRRDPVDVAGLERFYTTYERRLRRAADRHGLDRPAVITAHPFVAAFADLEWAGPVTLLASDDWAAHPAYRRWHDAYLAAYERIAARRRRVCAVTAAIIERIAPLGPATVVPNGVQPSEWLDPGPSPMAELPGPLFLYVGTLDSRLDTEAVLELARAWPGGSVALVGPHADRAHLEILEKAPNVILPGPAPREQVAALVHAADVCLVPHRRTPLTEAMSPLKIYEYLAGGGPVVATDLPPVRGIEGPVELVPPGGDFVSAARAALARGPMTESERGTFVERNAWSRRCATVLALALGD
jgi:teichuronic acid biosynthesis glycosyltransferase TuaH